MALRSRPLLAAAAMSGGAIPAGPAPGPQTLSETGSTLLTRLRFGLERSYRAQARLAPDRRRRIKLVDVANAVLPWLEAT